MDVKWEFPIKGIGESHKLEKGNHAPDGYPSMQVIIPPLGSHYQNPNTPLILKCCLIICN